MHHCCTFQDSNPKKYKTALVKCLEKGMKLAKFDNQDEFDAVTGIVSEEQ